MDKLRPAAFSDLRKGETAGQMKENKYDQEVFFKKYAEMLRSQKGLEGAGEWHELRKLMPDFQDRKVLDLGCGYGWHCKYAAEQGASEVLGIDISRKMIHMAQKKNAHQHIVYRQAAMEDLEFPEKSFEIVISSLALHYVEDYSGLVHKIAKWIKTGGYFLFSVEHPVFTAYGNQDWYYDENGEILHFPVDRYFEEGKREAVFLGECVTKYHRTLTSYLETLRKEGFELRDVIEPQPPENMRDIPGMELERKRPMMLIISSVKGEKEVV